MRTPQTLSRVVASDPVLAAWDARRRREAALTYAIRGELPRQLAMRVRVADAQRETLELVADSGAVAAAVRQRLPGVLERLAKDGHEFSGIRVRVQVRIDPEPTAKKEPNQLDSTTAEALSQLASSLPDGALRRSLERLARRGR